MKECFMFLVECRSEVRGFFSIALGLYCVSGLSRISVSGGCSSLQHTGSSLGWLICCRVWSLELGLQQLRGPALVAPWHVGSSQTRTLSPELAVRFPSTVPSGKFVVLVMRFFFFSFLFQRFLFAYLGLFQPCGKLNKEVPCFTDFAFVMKCFLILSKTA
ncbi:hypothetical protein MJG53_018997 [Ovis ammon polii x Ovis aries]|uniref:Uncharacterized protein n=1 Tax=Ovis ammon polii x Ovis aries TaxID=2918886 RepID=A0ACB9U3R5_9CETA|nr:hypothetical protein MJG53_018997 [Ovis ammon polii x Ovis aries]